jgi:hypothetical protein
MKTMIIVEEAAFMLTEETRNDKALNPIDLDVLAVCQYVANYKQLDYDKDGWVILPLARNEKIKSTSLQEYLEQWGVSVSDDTVRRSVNKLRYLGYLEYKKGYYHSHSDSQLAEIKILKGTVANLIQSEVGLITAVSDGYEDIAVTTDTNTEPESKKESFNIGTYRNCDDKCSPSFGEGELREILKKYIPDGFQRGEVISWVQQQGMEKRSVWRILKKCYVWDVIPLQPLLKYYEEQPRDEVSMAIFQVLKDKDLDEYTQFCTWFENNHREQRKETPTVIPSGSSQG